MPPPTQNSLQQKSQKINEKIAGRKETLLRRIQREATNEKLKAWTSASRAWFVNKVRHLNSPDDIFKKLMVGARSTHSTRVYPSVGSLYTYTYDPKTKATLPYYDIYPLIFPIEIYKDGWLGINLHYLPPRYRLVLISKMLEYLEGATDKRNNWLNISYSILKRAGRMPEFEPCIKRYLVSHVRSPLVKVAYQEWETAVFLPLAAFQKASKAQVWRDSIARFKTRKKP